MKVALVLDQFDVARGGQERSVGEMACALSELGTEVTIVARRIAPAHDGTSRPFTVRELAPQGGLTRAGRAAAFERAAAEMARRGEYDIVHSMIPLVAADVYQPRGGSVAFSTRRHAAAYNSAVLAALKRTTGWFNQARQRRIAHERRLCAAAGGPVVAALSEYVAGQFRSEYGLPGHRLRLIRNGVNVEAVRTAAARAQGRRLRELYDRNGDLALLVFIAEDFRRKGLGCLLAAAQRASQLRSGERDFCLFVFGREYYGGYRRQARALGVADRVLFMGVSRQIPAVLAMSDGLVLPTYDDACSRVVMEGLAAGRPAVTTRFNGAADFLGAGKYGVVVESPRDIEGLARGILRLCDRQEQQAMGTAIEADRVYEQVSMRRHARELMELYQELVARRQHSRRGP
jgi:UDP-glucose:(heptosyl)LPS alpha-1,3-glucosyltransferase